MLNIMLTLFLSSLLFACQTTSPQEQRAQDYLDQIKELKIRLQKQIIKTKLSTSRQVTGVQSENSPREGFAELKKLENLRLPSTRFRRIQLNPNPQLDFRQFMSLSNCSLSRHIAFRNSPMGRMMLPSQELAYNHRFLKAAKECDDALEPRLKEKLEKVVNHKQDQWSSLKWNAVWGGTTIAKFFSQAGPRGYKIKPLDSQLESIFAWLADIHPSYKGDLSAELEHKLKQISSYVGGQILSNAYHYWLLLKQSRSDLIMIKELSHILNQDETANKNRVLLCEKLGQSMALFIQEQNKISRAYQQLEALQNSFAGLVTLEQVYPTIELQEFIEQWLSLDHPNSIRKELKQLIKEQVGLWLYTKKNLACD